MIASGVVSADQTTLIIKEQEELPGIEFTDSRRDGWIIDKEENIHDAKIELDGYIDEIGNAIVNIEVGSTLSHSVSLSLEGKAKKIFIGFDLSNVDMENPETVFYSVGDRTVRRYLNAEEMYALFVTFDKKERADFIKPINRLGKPKEALFGLFESHPRMFPLLKGLLKKCSGVEINYGEMEVFEDGTGWIHCSYTINDDPYDLATTISLQQENLNQIIDNLPDNPQPLYSLNVPYRTQWEFLPDITRVLRGCGPACAAMMEEWYDGDHPNLHDLWNWRPVPSTGWVRSDIKDYLDEHVDGNFFSELYENDDVDNCINYVKEKLDNGRPIVVLMKSPFSFLSDSNHWQVIEGYEEDWFKQAFLVNDPFYLRIGLMHYHDVGLGWFLWWPNDRSFEAHAWKPYGNKIHIVYQISK